MWIFVQEIHLCTSAQQIKPQKQHLLGEKECSWGPQYWCASRENAAKCNVSATFIEYKQCEFKCRCGGRKDIKEIME